MASAASSTSKNSVTMSDLDKLERAIDDAPAIELSADEEAQLLRWINDDSGTTAMGAGLSDLFSADFKYAK